MELASAPLAARAVESADPAAEARIRHDFGADPHARASHEPALFITARVPASSSVQLRDVH
jgi:hypothetical protein